MLPCYLRFLTGHLYCNSGFRKSCDFLWSSNEVCACSKIQILCCTIEIFCYTHASCTVGDFNFATFPKTAVSCSVRTLNARRMRTRGNYSTLSVCLLVSVLPVSLASYPGLLPSFSMLHTEKQEGLVDLVM